MRERQLSVGRAYIKAMPEVYNEVMDEGRLAEARKIIRRGATGDRRAKAPRP